MKKTITLFFLTIILFTNLCLYGQVENTSSNSAVGLNFEECNFFEIHPIDEDFDLGKEGRVLISTKMDGDNGYYSDYQQDDGKIKIKAYLHLSQVGTTIYFRAIDPDLDDESSYEDNLNGNDNRDINIGAGVLSATEVNTIDDGGVFVEFVWDVVGGGTPVPKYTSFPPYIFTSSDPADRIRGTFLNAWFNAAQAGDTKNIFQLMAIHNLVNAAGEPIGGSTISAYNTSAVDATLISDNWENILVAHEFGHQFNVSNDHVDETGVFVNTHLGTGDYCVMSYDDINNQITEFDNEENYSCIKQIRTANDPR